MCKDSVTSAWIRHQIKNCIHGSQQDRDTAHNELAEALWPVLVRTAHSYQRRFHPLATCSAEVAEDAAVHTYIRFVENLTAHSSREDILRWFHITIRNFMRSEIRFHTRHVLTSDQIMLDQMSYATTRLLAHQPLYARLRMLGFMHTGVIYFRYWEDVPQSLLAAFYGVRRQRISQLEAAALKALKEAFEREGFTESGGADAAL